MANRCYIKVFVPLEELPEDMREPYRALYKAQTAAREKFKDSEGIKGNDYDDFIASQPGVPFERTKSTYQPWDFDADNDPFFESDKANPLINTLKPDSEQWNTPSIYADFYEDNGEVYAHIDTYYSDKPLVFYLDDDDPDFPIKSRVDIKLTWGFKWSFRWWAEVCFAGGKKHSGDIEGERGWLSWDLSVDTIYENLSYIMKVYDNLPVAGQLKDWLWAVEERTRIEEMHKWFGDILRFFPKAFAVLDWSEVAWNMMSPEEAAANDSPNQIMADIKQMEKDALSMTPESFLAEYGPKEKTNAQK